MSYKPPCQGLIDSRNPDSTAKGKTGIVYVYYCPVCGVERRSVGPLDRNDFAPVKRCYSRFFNS